MTLNTISSTRIDGLAGTGGASGTNGYYLTNMNGGAGGDGTAGKSVNLAIPVQTFTGDAGGDVVNLGRHAVGGSAGGGGLGGRGESAQVLPIVYTTGPGFSRTDADYGPSGNAGAGGLAGAAGRATTTFADLAFDLAGGATAQNSVTLQGTAWGGQGGFGGSSGNGGNSNWLGTWITTSTAIPPFSQIYDQGGTAGAAGLDGADGAVGGLARVNHANLTVTGENVLVNLWGTTIAGAGGGGGQGSRSGNGSFAPDAGNGGAGGAGGAATSAVAGLVATVTGGLQLNVYMDARGGSGANGGAGNDPTAGNTNNSNYVGDVGSSQNIYTYGAAGAGGHGGKGGAATASVTGSTITGSAAVDAVSFSLTAWGGLGGAGGLGGNGVASSSTVGGNNQTTTIIGTPDGLDGAKGANGRATVTFSNNLIDLGDGNDTLTLGFVAPAQGGRVTMRSNVLDGGGGTGDTLRLGTQTLGETGFIADVKAGTLRIGNGPTNAMTGFEVFRGGSGEDRFLDGTGSQTYSGGFGADRFEFRPSAIGTDRIESLAVEDVIRLTGFGAALDSFADVLAVTTATGSGALIQLSGTAAILLAGVSVAALQIDDFLFT